MNKTLILSCIFLLVLSSFAIAVDTGNLTETNENITLYFDNTGTLTKNYPGFFNVTWNSSQGWAKVNNGSVIVTYNVSSGESWALYQDPTTCVMPYEDVTPTTTQQANFCNGLYPGLHDTNGNGVIIAGANSINITCNGGSLIGNLTASSYGILVSGKTNVHVENCNLINYTQGERILTSNFFKSSNVNITSTFSTNRGITLHQSFNSTLEDNRIEGTQYGIYDNGASNSTLSDNYITKTGYAIYLQLSSDVANGEKNKLFNNRLVDNYYYSFYLSLVNNASLYNNSVTGGTQNNGTVNFDRVNNSQFYGNTVTDIYGTVATYPALEIYGVSYNTIFRNNTIKNYRKIAFAGYNLSIINNNLEDSDIGISMGHCYNCSIQDNRIINVSRNDDGYNLGIYLNSNCTNPVIQNNTINYGHVGIWIQQARNVTILNTTCNQFSLTDIVNGAIRDVPARYGYYHYYEPTACILLGEQYEGWVGDYTESATDTNSKFIKYNVTDVYIAGVSGNSNVQTYLHTVGVFGNQYYDLPSYWYVKFLSPANMTDADEFYNNPLWDSLQIVPKNNSGISSTFRKNRAGMGLFQYDEINYTISKTLLTFYNNKSSVNNLTLYNLTPPYNDIRINGVVSALNQPNYSITLNPGDLVEVSDFTYCGDGIVQSPNDNSSFMEDCDGANLNSQTCLSVGFTKGTLSCNSCSFVTTDCQAKSQLCQDNLVPLSGMTTWLGLLVTIICIAFVFIIFTDNSINIKMEGNTFYTTVLIIISVGFLIGVGILILSNLC